MDVSGEEKYAADPDAPPPANEIETVESVEEVPFDMPTHDHRHDVVEEHEHFHHHHESKDF